MIRFNICLKLALLCAVSATGFFLQDLPAAEISGVKLPDQVTVDGKTLKLNGTGLRQATILKFNVYAAGLYVESPSHDAETIANSEGPKSIQMVLLRDVTAKQMAEAFQDGFEKNCTADCARLKPEIGKLQGMLKDMKKGETMVYHFTSQGVELVVRGQKVGSLGDKAFSRQLLRVWIGKIPPNAELKDGLLGGKK